MVDNVKKPCLYLNNTNADLRQLHAVIVEAIKNNGIFTEDFADIFVLTKTPENSACEWVLNFL